MLNYTVETAPLSNVSGHCPDTYPIGLSGFEELRPGELGPPTGKARFPYEDLFPLLKDYALFSHALLLLSGLPVDPVAVFCAERNIPDRERPVMFPASGPLFSGLPFPWDHVVFAAPLEHAPGLLQDLARVTGYSPQTGGYWDAAHQFLERPFPVNVFALSSVQKLWHWVPDLVNGRYVVKQSRGLPDVLASVAYTRKVTNITPRRKR